MRQQYGRCHRIMGISSHNLILVIRHLSADLRSRFKRATVQKAPNTSNPSVETGSGTGVRFSGV